MTRNNDQYEGGIWRKFAKKIAELNQYNVDMPEDIQHCQCGNETYHIKRRLDVEEPLVWAECTECGRPTRVLGDGRVKQLEWYNEQ